MNNKDIIKIAKFTKLNINKDISNEIKIFYSNLEININKMKKINIDNVEPMTRINNEPISFLREDVVKKEQNISKKYILLNASHSQDDFVVVNNERPLNDK